MYKRQELEYVIIVTELPKVDIKELNKIKINEYDIKIDNKETEKRIEEISKNQNNFVAKADAETSKDGDMVVFDYKATINEKEFKGGDGKNAQGIFISTFLLYGIYSLSSSNDNAGDIRFFNSPGTVIPTYRGVNSNFNLRRGFEIKKGQKVLIVEDVITTGKSSLECSSLAKKLGAEIVGYACIIDRSNGKIQIDKTIVSQVQIEIPTYNKENLPKHLQNIKKFH